jgi:periplasmic divalent cation tolerance protein
MSEVIDVWVNCASRGEAERIAEAAIGGRLAACANLYPPIASAYRWHGRIERAEEIPLLLKTRPDLFDGLARLICRLHSYETPSVVGIRVDRVTADYAAWVAAETVPATDAENRS